MNGNHTILNYWSLGTHYATKNKKQKVVIDDHEIQSDDSDCEIEYFDNEAIQIPDQPDIQYSKNSHIIIHMSLENATLEDSYLQGSIVETECNFTTPLCNNDEPLYNGSSKSVGELLLILEFIKTSSHLGDITQSLILGLLGSFLPIDNAISKYLSTTSSTVFHYQKFIKILSETHYTCSIHKVPICINGCTAFIGLHRLHRLQRMCPICSTLRII